EGVFGREISADHVRAWRRVFPALRDRKDEGFWGGCGAIEQWNNAAIEQCSNAPPKVERIMLNIQGALLNAPDITASQHHNRRAAGLCGGRTWSMGAAEVRSAFCFQNSAFCFLISDFRPPGNVHSVSGVFVWAERERAATKNQSDRRLR